MSMCKNFFYFHNLLVVVHINTASDISIFSVSHACLKVSFFFHLEKYIGRSVSAKSVSVNGCLGGGGPDSFRGI